MTRRQILMIGCAASSLFASAPALGQAFNANPTTVMGSVAYDRATPGVETVTIQTPTAIINWDPTVGGNPLVFLPAGNTATFTNGINNTDYVVLNRIITTVPVRFDGNVIGQLQDFIAGTSGPGGTILFASPNGIIIGSTARFDVGNLVLTTLAAQAPAGGSFYDPATQGFVFAGGDKFPNAAIVTEPGAQIRALNEGSYVAMLAPRVIHGGSVRVNGGAAYVAAEALEFRANQGLFDIIVTTGSDNATTLIHSGTTGGPASTDVADVHRIYMVAVPKNQAITSILEGSVGFDDATVVGVENGAIVLSAGYSVLAGNADRFADSGVGPVPGQDASFEIRGGTVRSDLSGSAVTDMLASGVTTGSLVFLGDVSLFGGARAHLSAGAGETVTVGGTALVSTARSRTIDLVTIDLVGGEALIFAEGGGSLDIFGNAIVDSSAKGVVNPLTSTAGNGTGGMAGITTDGGSVRIRGDLSLLATGEGGTIDFAPNRGGIGTGGDALVDSTNGGAIRIDGSLTMNASGTGSRSSGSIPLAGAGGSGGDVAIVATGNGRIDVAGAATLTSNGRGGNVLGGAGISGGTGSGGTILVDAGGPVTFSGNVAMTADAVGGNGPAGGTADGGTLILAASSAGPAGGGTLTAPDVTGTANAAGVAATGNSPGEWHVRAAGGGTVALANLTLTAAVNGPPTAPPFSSLEPQGGTINVVGIAALATPADILVIGDGGGTILGGRYNLNAGGDVAMTHANPAPGGFTFDVTDLFANAGDDFSATAGVVTRTANQIDIRAVDNASVGGQILGRNILIVSASLDIAGTGIVGGPATVQTELRTSGASSIAGRVLGSDILVTAANIGVTPTGAIGDATGQETELRAVSTVDVAGSLLGRNVIVDGATIDVPGTAGDGATERTTLNASGAATVSGRVLGGDILVTASGISVTPTGAVGDASSQETELRAVNAVDVAGTALGRNIAVTGATVNVGGTIGSGATVQANLAATGAATISGRVLGSDILITGAGVNVTSAGAVGDAATQEAELRAANTVSVAGNVLGRTIIVDGAAVNVAGTGTIGGQATDQANLTARATATVAGRVLGRGIRIASSDIDIQTGGSVGDGATQLAVLQIAAAAAAGGAAQPAVLGGATQGPGYTLTNAEAGRVRAGMLRILAPAIGPAPNRDPDLFVRDLTLNGGGAANGVGTLEIVTPGIARVEGALLMTNAAAASGISFTAQQRLEVVTPAGSVRVRDGAGAPGGTMTLASDNIWVASPVILDRLRTDPKYTARDDDLIDNGGVETPRGFVEAGGVTLATGGTLFVQNSGATGGSPAADIAYAGITVGAGGLTVRSTGATPAVVNAFGRRLNPDGSFTDGDSFFFQTDFQTNRGGLADGYTGLSELNNCLIVTGQCPRRLPPTTGPGGPDPTTGPTGGSDSILLPPGAEDDDLIDTSFSAEGLIEEPITSGGESNLWSPDCDRDNDGDCEEGGQ